MGGAIHSDQPITVELGGVTGAIKAQILIDIGLPLITLQLIMNNTC